MLNFILLIGIMNMLGGRWADVYGETGNGRLIFRCLLPGIISGLTAWQAGMSPFDASYVWAAVTVGSALWFSPGWSFDEIDGKYDALKYPLFVKKIGLHFFPLDSSPTEASTNRKRGMLMKGLRGLFDYPTYVLLSAVTPWALAIGGLSALQGVVYWAIGRINQPKAVLIAEDVWGMVRGLMIGSIILWKGLGA